MFVTVQLTAEAARTIRQQTTPTVQVKELLQIAHDLNVTLEPLHPTIDLESELATYFIVAVTSEKQGRQIAERFLEAEATEAAYFKPPAEPAENKAP